MRRLQQPEEFAFLRPDLVLFTYLHLAAYPAVGRALLQAGTTAIAYETVQLAARLAAAMDAEVFLLDLSPERLRRLESQRQGRLVSLVSSRETTHTAPVITRHGVQHDAVGNMPGAVPFTATEALVSVTLPYIAAVAGRGLVDAVTDRPELVSGLNTVAGSLCHPGVAKALGAAHASSDGLPELRRRSGKQCEQAGNPEPRHPYVEFSR
jgi:alanine dehydrogenase